MIKIGQWVRMRDNKNEFGRVIEGICTDDNHVMVMYKTFGDASYPAETKIDDLELISDSDVMELLIDFVKGIKININIL